MYESGTEKNMPIEVQKTQDLREPNPEFNISYPVQFQPAACKVIAEPLNTLLAFEVGLGKRSATNNVETFDALERLKRSFMIGKAQDYNFPISLSENDIRFLEDRFNEYATAKALSKEEILIQSEFLLLLRERLDRAINVPNFQEKRPDSFGVGSNSILGRWARERTGKGKFD